MSTTNGEPQRWMDSDYDAQGYESGESECTGYLSWSHTSDTVAWVVCERSVYVMSPAEFRALRNAVARWDT